MGIFDITTILMVLTAVFSYINYRTLKLPTTIGVMGVSLLVSLGIAGMGAFGVSSPQYHAERIVSHIDFNKTLLHGMLAFLLFAGALQIKFSDLTRQKWVITLLSTVGVIVSTFIVGGLTWLMLGRLGMPVRFIHCLLFGALISPTDPVAVIAILKTSGVPKSLETKRVDDYQLEVIITLALVMGGYSLADRLHTSGPLAMVAAGLLVGNHGREFAMSDTTREHLDSFWELIDEILNAILFMLIGLEVQIMDFSWGYVTAGLAAIGIALLARWASVSVSVSIMRPFRRFSPGVISMLTWGGLRGGISVALALSLPPWPGRNTLLAITYIVVVFSILVQGLTLGKLAQFFNPGRQVKNAGL
jgi:CPA1 family monovalent cation:H+ antiporter